MSLPLGFSLVGLSGLLAVALGAFGAHGLKGRISAELLHAFQTGVHYQMFHTVALFVLFVAISHLEAAPKLWFAGTYCWLVGVILFSGSLYGLALGGPAWLGPITPFGGLLLMLGWLFLAIGAWQLGI